MSERDIFTAALGHGEPAGRAAYLDKACEGNPALRARLELLLRAHERPDSLLDASIHAPAAAVPGELAREAGLGDGPTRTFGGSGSSGTGSTTDLTFLVPSSRPDSLGRIGHYDVLELLGRGGFGIVFRAFDDVLQRVVAVKVLTPQLAATSPARKRFLREARSSAAVRHENVVQVYAVEELPLPYLVMEFIPGETLQDRLRRTGPIEVLEIVRLGRQIALGLEAAHAQGLVHRDVKPGNVLIEARTPVRVKLTDFGLARAADDASISQSGIVAGTPMYMSPEQARGGTLDHRSDLFSLGSVLYVMCTGRPPFRAEGTFAVLKRVVEDVPRPIREVIPETPEWLCQIIAKLHVKDPAGRFQTAREVADLFAACESCLETGSKFKDLLPVSPEPPVRTRKWQRVAAAALVLPLLLGGVFAWKWLANRSNTAAAPGDNSTEKGQLSGLEGTGDRATLAVAPFDDATAKEYQQLWAGRSGVPVESLNSIGMNMRLIPPGRFPNSAQPDRLITISKPFQMSAYETTVAQFRQFVNDTNYRTDAEKTGHGFVKHSDGALEEGPQFTWQHAGVAPGNDYPVGQLSWNDAMAFCRWLSQKEGKTYRLPTEAEWEWACRAGGVTDYHFGNDEGLVDAYAWHAGNSDDHSHPVGLKKPNAWGLFDMHGNVGEYCFDWSAPLPTDSDLIDPKGPAQGKFRVIRSLGFFDPAVELKLSQRGAMSPGASMNHFGFRVLGELAPASGKAPSVETRADRTPPSDLALKRFTALPPEKQLEEVRAELKRRNPELNGKITSTIRDGKVTGLGLIEVTGLADISPLSVLTALEEITLCPDITDISPLRGLPLRRIFSFGATQFTDLSPLKGMPLELVLLWQWKGDDLSPLRGMRLKFLNCGGGGGKVDMSVLKDMPLEKLYLMGTDVKDLSMLAGMKLQELGLSETSITDLKALHGMPLESLTCNSTAISDLTPLQGMPLTKFYCRNTRVTDLRPIAGLPLKELQWDFNADRDTEIIRGFKSLETINEQPVAEFWKSVGK